DAAGLGQRLVDRVGQRVLTCPTTARFDGLPAGAERVMGGGLLRHFGDRYQWSKCLEGERFWRIPVVGGGILVQETFGGRTGIGGGNLLILARDHAAALAAAEAAADAMRTIRGVILPFPGGIVRSGSKVGAKHYAKMVASTNDAYCPTLRARGDVASALPLAVNAVFEIVVDGLDSEAIEAALRAGIDAARRPGVVEISAGNYGGKLGKHHFHLHRIAAGADFTTM